jgi:hypothetical protein
MTTTLDHNRAAERVQALVQLLRNRSYEEIRQRMYDNPPGSAWWMACKTELEVRNNEQTATALQATSRVLEKMRSSTEQMERLAQTLSEATEQVAILLDGARESGRRLELAVYVLIGVTVVQLFFLTFQAFGKR